MQRVMVLGITCLLGFVVLSRTAVAHVAPSVDDNNRYLKLTPAADRIRVAYTVFFGENPGRQMRPGLDANKDGVLSDDEGTQFGTKLAREVADGIELTIDGVTRPPVHWETVAVGLGTPDVGAGSFSVDMIAYVCVSGARHSVLLRDRFRVPRPGETEVKVEDAPGITIEHARVGPFDNTEHDYKLVGPGGPLMDDGLDLAFVVTDKAPRGDQQCADAVAAAPETSSSVRWIVLGIGAALALVVIVLVVRRRAVRSRI